MMTTNAKVQAFLKSFYLASSSLKEEEALRIARAFAATVFQPLPKSFEESKDFIAKQELAFSNELKTQAKALALFNKIKSRKETTKALLDERWEFTAPHPSFLPQHFNPIVKEKNIVSPNAARLPPVMSPAEKREVLNQLRGKPANKNKKVKSSKNSVWSELTALSAVFYQGKESDSLWLSHSKRWSLKAPYALEFIRAKEIDLLKRGYWKNPILELDGSNAGAAFHAVCEGVRSLLSFRKEHSNIPLRSSNVLPQGIVRREPAVNNPQERERIANWNIEAQKRASFEKHISK